MLCYLFLKSYLSDDKCMRVKGIFLTIGTFNVEYLSMLGYAITCLICLFAVLFRDGIPYCESDYHAQFGVKCETCSRYISGRVLEVGVIHFHLITLNFNR